MLDGVGTKARFGELLSMAIDSSNNLYVTDSNLIRKVSAIGNVSTIAGGGLGGSTASTVSFFFNNPPGGCGITVDSNGNVYVTQYNNRLVLQLNQVTGTLVSVAGSGLCSGTTGFSDGVGSNQLLSAPTSLSVDWAGNLFIYDSFTIRKVTVGSAGTSSVLTTIAGLQYTNGYADGNGSTARLKAVAGMTVDAAGNLFFVDANGLVRMISASTSNVTTVAGRIGGSGLFDAVGTDAVFSSLKSVALSSSGTLYVSDYIGPNAIRSISLTPCLAPFSRFYF